MHWSNMALGHCALSMGQHGQCRTVIAHTPFNTGVVDAIRSLLTLIPVVKLSVSVWWFGLAVTLLAESMALLYTELS